MTDKTVDNIIKKRVSIVGCGWLGVPLATQLLAEGYLVKGSTTTPEKVPLLQQIGVEAYVASLGPEPVGTHWSELLDTDCLIVDIPPRLSRQLGDFHPQQMQNLAEMVLPTSISEIIYVSTTSVYPELSRVLVEEDVVDPGTSASPMLVQAEQIMNSLRTKTRHVTVLRSGGLMGYDRIPGKYVRGKKDVSTGQVPVNYVHRDDVVKIINALLARGIGDETYNVVAPQHPVRRRVYETSCQQFGWEVPTFVDPAWPEPFKVLSSEKLTTSLAYDWRYPDPLTFYYAWHNPAPPVG